MSLFLAGVPGKLKTLTDRLTNSTTPLNDTRVGYLDASIAGRASQTSVNTIDTNVDSILATVTANLDAAVSTMGSVAQATFSNSASPAIYSSGSGVIDGIPYTAVGTTWADDTYKTLIDVTTGSGWLYFLALQDISLESGTSSIRLTIDGATPVVFSGSISSGTQKMMLAIGAYNGVGLAYQPTRFNASLKIEIKSNVSSGTPDDNWSRLYVHYSLE
jgi:hypothetical protein